MPRPLLAAALSWLLALPAAASWELGVKAMQQGDYARAAKFLARVAKDDVRAQFALGILYLSGQGVERDEERGANWIKRAANNDLPAAQTVLGSLYTGGRGVEQSDSEASRWFRRAAAWGDREGQAAIGILSHVGRGVPKSDIEAFMWLSLAERQGHVRAAEFREVLEPMLSPVQLATAKQRIAAWKPRKPPVLSNWYNMEHQFFGYDPNGDVYGFWPEF
jgi:hypothetical protein